MVCPFLQELPFLNSLHLCPPSDSPCPAWMPADAGEWTPGPLCRQPPSAPHPLRAGLGGAGLWASTGPLKTLRRQSQRRSLRPREARRLRGAVSGGGGQSGFEMSPPDSNPALLNPIQHTLGSAPARNQNQQAVLCRCTFPALWKHQMLSFTFERQPWRMLDASLAPSRRPGQQREVEP